MDALVGFWRQVEFGTRLVNSILISAAVPLFAVAISVLAAFALRIGQVRHARAVLVVFLMTIMIPQESLAYPLFYLAKWVGLFDSLWAIVVVLTVLQSAFGIYLLSAVLSTFPTEIVDAAEIDGAAPWQRFPANCSQTCSV